MEARFASLVAGSFEPLAPKVEEIRALAARLGEHGKGGMYTCIYICILIDMCVCVSYVYVSGLEDGWIWMRGCVYMCVWCFILTQNSVIDTRPPITPTPTPHINNIVKGRLTTTGNENGGSHTTNSSSSDSNSSSPPDRLLASHAQVTERIAEHRAALAAARARAGERVDVRSVGCGLVGWVFGWVGFVGF